MTLTKNIQEVKQKYQVSGIVAGMDAQVEVKPRQVPFVGDGTRMSRGNTMRSYEMESKFGTFLMEWITKHEICLLILSAKIRECRRARTNRIDFWKQSEQQLQKWKSNSHQQGTVLTDKESDVF